MTPEEIDNALSELSNRLERVRALYEQYFMGIERTAPNIPRKDLDRRMEALRKTPFQNTAKRFKFQTLVQRYTSLQQYWYRTCRDIENGTYRKHLQRAKRRFGEDDDLQQDTTEQKRERAEQAVQAKEAAENDLASLLEADIDLGAEFEKALGALKSPAKPSPQPDLKGSASLLSGLKKTEAGHTAQARPSLSLGKLSIKPSVQPGTLANKKQPKDTTPERDPTATSMKSPKPSPASPTLSSRPKAPAPAPLKPLPRLTATAPKRAAPPPAPLPKVTAAAKPAPARPAPSPAADKPAVRPAPTATRAAATGGGASGLSEDRIRAIHAQYQNARTQTNAATVSFEKLERNIRQTEAQLRAKHKGKNVDFDVGIKDGKAILKPRLK